MDELERPAASTLAPDGAASDLVAIKLDSCHSTWYFQPARKRFRRTLKFLGVPGVSTGWRPYYGLCLDDALDGFVVLLNPQGTRLLRSWRHQPGSDVCANCAGHLREKVSLGDVRQFASE